MQRIEGTWFLMGSEDGEDNERPIHRVWVDTFEIGACQVTNGEYSLFLEATSHPEPPCFHDPAFSDPWQPVVAVSWFDAALYCEWLGKVRLPTEAEWECAARGGKDGTRYPWGNDIPDGATRALRGPQPVGSHLPNEFGLYDICTNVHEWCSDWYAADYYSVSPERNPRGPQTGSRRVSRGGSWRHQITVSRCAARSSLPPEFRYADYGFRIAASET